MLAFLSDSIPGFRYRAKKEKFIKHFEKKVKYLVNLMVIEFQTWPCFNQRRGEE